MSVSAAKVRLRGFLWQCISSLTESLMLLSPGGSKGGLHYECHVFYGVFQGCLSGHLFGHLLVLDFNPLCIHISGIATVSVEVFFCYNQLIAGFLQYDVRHSDRQRRNTAGVSSLLLGLI